MLVTFVSLVRYNDIYSGVFDNKYKLSLENAKLTCCIDDRTLSGLPDPQLRLRGPLPG